MFSKNFDGPEGDVRPLAVPLALLRPGLVVASENEKNRVMPIGDIHK